jgi:4a-hydroxytetrahydrobiopterin dehydratase
MPKIEPPAIKSALTNLPEWKKKGTAIVRIYQFKDFVVAMKFVNAVAKLAEKFQHHPDIDIRWNKVSLLLTTHDAGGLTEKDFASAVRFDVAAGKLG